MQNSSPADGDEIYVRLHYRPALLSRADFTRHGEFDLPAIKFGEVVNKL